MTVPSDADAGVRPSPDGLLVDSDERVVAQLVELLAERAPERGSSIVADFARAALRRSAAARLEQQPLDELAAQMLGAFEFVDRREPGTLALRVYNATLEEHGWQSRGTVVETNLEDSPFLLSTMTEELGRLGLDVATTIHPVFGVERDAEGRVRAIVRAREARNRESWMLVEVSERLDPAAHADIAENLRRVLSDARAATRDYPSMKERVEDVAFEIRASAGARYPRDEVDEALAFLEWLRNEHMVMLGYREYALERVGDEVMARVVPGSGLGILADESQSSWQRPVPLSQVADGLRARIEGGDLLVVARTNRVSTVHRHVRMVYVGVKKVTGDGGIAGEYRFVGLFAQRAMAEPASTIPVLRRKLRQVLEREDVVDHSYDERALRALFEAFPKTELFEMDVEQLRRALMELLQSQARQEVRLLLRATPDAQAVSALVALPRGRFNAQLRQQVQQLLLERTGGATVDYHLSLTDRDQAVLSFRIHAAAHRSLHPLPPVAQLELEREIRDLARGWADAVRDELVRVHGPAEGERLARLWVQRFPPGYAETTHPRTAVGDIVQLDRLSADVPVRFALRAPSEGRPDLFRFNLFKAGAGVELSDFLPILESLGLTVVEEIPYRIEGPQGELHIHDFGVRADDLDVERHGPRLADAALATWEGRAEADSLNRLVLAAALPWDDVALLRAYRRYRRQIGISFTEAYENDAFVEHPSVARALVELFAVKFDPARDAAPGDVAAAHDAVVAACDEIERLDHDRILRGYLGLIDATVRTNRWRVPRAKALSLKLVSAQVPGVPKPVPYVEVFVYAPDTEAIHLRGGPVARGGIRWSDRYEDFRVEVLGLMKAQMVKNAVIVPTGSKGGFVVKRAPTDPAAMPEAVRDRYQTYIRALLDVTDNVVDGRVVAPPGVRRADGDDPYLVVAADRGTATFSDLANAISRDYGFWLDDAFASGGSQGYDHKAMGITARGAWVAVQRHFRELNVDVQSDPITVVGIGDMSGDVFGNGMLQSRAIRLIGAFDHRDIFLDPDPDPERSYEERARLFALPRSSWQNYDRSLISAGGGVWSRTTKRIPLSPQAREVLRVSDEHLSAPDLIRALMSAPVDLLFAGGIGTFVKATTETHTDVGDRANDAIRVDAGAVGARVVGEGGNLAFTQRARIQYARRGGRINTDAIDNSAGVDTSDHEVNLKILLGAAEAAGRLERADRNALLAAMTDDVAAAVLRDVYLQTGVLSQELQAAPGGMEAYELLMSELEASGRLDREVEALPSRDEIERRREAGAGLTRPELAVLLGYAKVDLTARLLASDLPDEPYLLDALRSYFPSLAVSRFPDLVGLHQLRRELVATVVANDVVNRLGITWVNRTVREMGARPDHVVAAYWVARDVADADAYWRRIEGLDGEVDPSLQLELKGDVDRLVDAYARSYIRQGLSGDIAGAVARDRPAFGELERKVHELARSPRHRGMRERLERYLDLGIDDDLAARLVSFGQLSLVPDVAAVARDSHYPVAHVADAFFRIAELLPLDRLHARLQTSVPTDRWERWQLQGLVDELRGIRRAAAAAALAAEPGCDGAEAAERYLAQRTAGRQRLETLLELLENDTDAGLDAVAVAVRVLRDAVGA